MNNFREIKTTLDAKPTLEGAGVKLNRVFGFNEVPGLDPFLLLDDFGSDDPQDYIAGFPWHPHRGIETVTYLLHGAVEHGDSIGNSGIINSGDVQWMTAGSGIIHQEMPKKVSGTMRGFQLWVNLPASHKMIHPRYQEIGTDQIPEVVVDEHVSVKIIAGQMHGKKGPVRDLTVGTEFFDVTMAPNSSFEIAVSEGRTSFAYIVSGDGHFQPESDRVLRQGQLVLYDDGAMISVRTAEHPVRFLLLSGAPLREPVAWLGPIVMNSQEELNVAFQELQAGTFIKNR
ncbi:MAG: pirin family protein [Candidatus Zhuqueibacterota bacterium]